ncbi:hypothetical protein RclHR1_06630001, partial [Rhizophagus clarus]
KGGRTLRSLNPHFAIVYIYQPRTEINEQIYDGILENITLDELDNIIRETKSGKAAGISGIPYDFWKKSKKETRKILLDIYNRILHEHKVLDDWKKGMIFPINKTTRSHWNNDINLTRPITLIETARKIFIKVLVKRLAKILSLNKVLQGSNYAALLNESTLEPLKIVQSIIEDANKENKEVWILLMDISKAFDSVSMIMLEKSLKRIKVPEPLIKIIMDINLNRTNKVIVNGEFTKEYEVEDGVDQGEVWSPLLWRIFYDALLTRLAKIKNETGYTMETTKHIDINKNISKKLEITYNASAFMDDTTLIGGNKQKLIKMIEICHEFFEINDIKANIKKYELIRINSSEDNENNELIINNEKIEKVNNPEENRFLGIYFRHDNRRKVYKDRIRSTINDACRLFRWKKLKEKQIIAIWNIVIIPRIEYQLQAIVLTEDECNELIRKINVLIKHSCDLPSTTPNFLLHDKDIYGLKHIYNLQIENLSKNIIYMMNDEGRLKEIMELKMIQEQNKIWTRQCIGNLNSKTFRRQNSWLINAIDLLKKEKISICNHEYNDKYIHHCIEGGTSEIIEFLTANEIEKNLERKVIITWNDPEGNTIFSENKKKSRSKKYKRIGVHLIPNSHSINDKDNSPTLIACTGCNKNIKRINDGICHIYIENENSRVINNRKEDNKIKPYESLGDIKNRNEKIITKNKLKQSPIIEEIEESKLANINYNKKIDEIDQMIEASENFIEELKNNIIEHTDEIYDTLIQIDIRDKGEDPDYIEIINDLETENELIMKKDEDIEAIHIEDEILKINEYNIYWNNNLIKWAYRRWSKIISQAKWKHELLHCKLVEDLFINNYKDEFDWEISLEFISNRNQCRKLICNTQDSLDRTYKIKNLLMILPTYKLLYDRGTNKINSLICPRCEEEIETWDHIWTCNQNEFNIKDVIENTIIEIEKNYITNGQRHETEENTRQQKDEDDTKIIFDNIETFNEIKVEFVLFLDNKSVILPNKKRYWELLRGIFNKNLNNLGKNKKGSKDIIRRLWELCYDNIKKEIWHKRTERTIEIEKAEGITKGDKRKRKREDKKSKEPENNKKQKNIKNKENTKKQDQNQIIKLVTYERSIGRSLNTGKKDGRWNTIQKLIPLDIDK